MMAGPPESMTGPTLGEQLDARLDLGARMLAQIEERLAQLSGQLARYAVDLEVLHSGLTALERRAERQT